MERIYIAGIRTADPLTLTVLTQDALRKTLSELDPRCLCDLLALGDASGLPNQLKWEIERFGPQMQREIHDLPAFMYGKLVRELDELEPSQIPSQVRQVLEERRDDLKDDPKTETIAFGLLDKVAGVPVDTWDVADSGEAQIEVKTFDVPDSHKAPDERKKRRVRKGAEASTAAPGETKKKAPSRTTSDYAARLRNPTREIKDPTRAVWIRVDVLDRLKNAQSGIKQGLLVVGCQRRAEWDDVAWDEVMNVLKQLAKEGRVRLSAGRWKYLG